jgi:hypothetical protein
MASEYQPGEPLADPPSPKYRRAAITLQLGVSENWVLDGSEETLIAAIESLFRAASTGVGPGGAILHGMFVLSWKPGEVARMGGQDVETALQKWRAEYPLRPRTPVADTVQQFRVGRHEAYFPPPRESRPIVFCGDDAKHGPHPVGTVDGNNWCLGSQAEPLPEPPGGWAAHDTAEVQGSQYEPVYNPMATSPEEDKANWQSPEYLPDRSLYGPEVWPAREQEEGNGSLRAPDGAPWYAHRDGPCGSECDER